MVLVLLMFGFNIISISKIMNYVFFVRVIVLLFIIFVFKFMFGNGFVFNLLLNK